MKGFHDVTPLAKLPWFDLVLGIVPDYMHGVLLGNKTIAEPLVVPIKI